MEFRIADTFTLHELGGVEANVATGYHAVEFLLWGQDLNGTGPGAGARPASDFNPANCSWGNCDRRAAYLQTATDLLVDDLAWMTAQWAPGGDAGEGLVGGDVTQGSPPSSLAWVASPTVSSLASVCSSACCCTTRRRSTIASATTRIIPTPQAGVGDFLRRRIAAAHIVRSRWRGRAFAAAAFA